MATSRRAKKGSRLEQIPDSPEVRRSPRLSQRLGRREDTYSALASITHSATLRPSLRNYGKHQAEPVVNILNESGQSVPPSFDMEFPEDSSSHRSSSREPGEKVATASADVPQHFFGLDDSDRESVYTDEVHPPQVTQWTPGRQPTSVSAPGLCPLLIGFCTSVLYKCGSLLYLAATAILCLDVILLQRFFHSGVSVRSFARFWVLPLVLFGIVLFLLGGNLIPRDSGPVEPPIPPRPPVNITDLNSLQSDLLKYIDSSIEEELTAFKVILRAQVDRESELRLQNLIELRDRIRNEVNATLELQLSLLKGAFDVQMSSLLTKVDESKKEWIDEVRVLFTANVNESTDSLHLELLNELKAVEKRLQHQLSDVDGSIMSEITTLKNSQQGLQEKQQSTTRELSDLQLHKNRQGEHIEEISKGHQKELAALKQKYLNLETQISNSDKQPTGHSSGGVSTLEVQKLIDRSIAKYNADKIGRFDFALESAGGTVLLNKCSTSYTPSLATVTILGLPLWHVSSTPKVIIQPQVYPGNCWAFQGSSGYATLKLKDDIVITGVALEHIPKELSPNGSLTSAPKEFSVLAMDSPDDKGILLGDFVYDDTGPSIQEFPVEEAKQKVAHQFVQFRFNSNYGNPDYTCVYRVRVHGNYLA